MIPHTVPVHHDRTRDEFAMAALTGLLASRTYWNKNDGLVYAKAAYTIADAMLKQREAS